MLEAVIAIGTLAALGVLVYTARRMRVRRIARERLAATAGVVEEEEVEHEPLVMRPFMRRHMFLPWLFGALVLLSLYYLVGLPPLFAVTFGLIAALLGMQLEVSWQARRAFLIEEQLGDALDLMVSALHAGAGVLSAMETAAKEVRRPLRPILEEVLGRIRYGDDPQEVFHALMVRVPFESFRLFSSAMSVHWEVGGSLAPTLAGVGRIIRDRIEIARRIRSVSAQARLSVITVLCVTYFIALVMWRSDPGRMEGFLSTAVGQTLVAAAVLLQAIGIVWSARVSRMRY